MAARVTLTITQGRLKGTEYVFEQPTVCTVGRARDCDVRLPDDPFHLTVSRRHCVLHVDPPTVRVQDCGSRNGTFVNGVKIGQRIPSDGGVAVATVDCQLSDGDEVRVGDLVFQVGIRPAPADFTGCPDEVSMAHAGAGETFDWCQVGHN